MSPPTDTREPEAVDRLNPQARQMADESMVRNLAAQAQAIWPQERILFDRYGIRDDARILDAGCGSGEITTRLAERFPGASLVGVDILDGPLAIARTRARGMTLGDRVRFEQQSVFDLSFAPASFDLTVCRHVLQAIPDAEEVIAELARVTRPGGRLHLLAEDYGMIHFPRRRRDPSEFWRDAPTAFGAATGTDLFVGRSAPGILGRLGLAQITVDYVAVDPLRTPRDTFAAIWEAWRDGYSSALAEHTRFGHSEVVDHFNDMIETIRDPKSYCVWLVPIISAVVV